MKLQNLVNHVVFVLDESYSMWRLKDDVINVFDEQIRFLSSRSQELNQETRVSVYKFNYKTECIIYDMDVMRTPSLKGLYKPDGGTALLDATGKAVADLKLTPEIYGDHAFLVFVLTDGEENSSFAFSPKSLNRELNALANNWSFGVLVPDQTGVKYAQSCGFERDSIVQWDVAAAGAIKKVGSKIQDATENFFQGRAKGVRSTKGLFQMNTAVSVTQVKKNLEQMSASEYTILTVRKDDVIKPFVESWLKSYRQGSAYYQLMKKETIQASKNILIREDKTGKVYGGDSARQMLGLPDQEVKVEPAHLKGFTIFVQSTSSNRKLIGGTELIVLT